MRIWEEKNKINEIFGDWWGNKISQNETIQLERRRKKIFNSIEERKRLFCQRRLTHKAIP